MSEEPRRSGRATKGQHNKKGRLSLSPVPRPAKVNRPKQNKKAAEPAPEEEEEEEQIRCVCGNDDADDPRAFIGCDTCRVWQHNVCMGITDVADDIPDQYFCEQCRPSNHTETLQAIARGEKIWETRNRIYQAEMKLNKSKKGKGRAAEDAAPGWLKKDILADGADNVPEAGVEDTSARSDQEVSSKRKRSMDDEIKEEMQDEPPRRGGRLEKRRKSGTTVPKAEPAPDPEHALVSLDQLPVERQKVAKALAKIMIDDIQRRVKTGFEIRTDRTPESLGEHFAVRVEYAMYQNFGGQPQYAQQFRALNANLKKNSSLIERLLDESLSSDTLATMESKDMASEELQRERAAMKEVLDRQAVAVEDEGPKYRHTHKGVERIDDEAHRPHEPTNNSAPVRERVSVAEGGENDETSSGSPATNGQTSSTAAASQVKSPVNGAKQRSASQQFDMNSIWAKTAQSPTLPSGPRLMQMPPRRRISIQRRQEPSEATTQDADIDRMLADQDDSYTPVEYTSDEKVVWSGKLVHSTGAGEPTVNARFVAGRDLAPTAPWDSILPDKLSVDGRLQISKAEEYLCGLEHSQTSDVTVLSLTPYDDAEAFNQVFDYFYSRERYAVVGKGLPTMVKDLYISPLEVGASLPAHISKLIHCTIRMPIEQRMLLATFVIARAPDTPGIATPEQTPSRQDSTASGSHIPSHLRSNAPGPAGSPITAQTPAFSPSDAANGGRPVAGYGAPAPFPANPYAPVQSGTGPYTPFPQHPNPLVNEILGSMQLVPTAQQVLLAEPNIDADRLKNLRRILESDPATQTDINALATRLFSG